MAEAQKAPKMEGSPGMHPEFLQACKGEKPWDYPKSNFIYAGAICEVAPAGEPLDPGRPEQETAVGLQEPEVHQ